MSRREHLGAVATRSERAHGRHAAKPMATGAGATGVLGWAAAALTLAVLVASTAGCEDDAVCFNCGPEGAGAQAASGATSAGGNGSGGDNDGGDCLFNCGGSGQGGDGGDGAGGPCVPTNGGVEICDEVDNDCNGTVDDDFDKNLPLHCGTCQNNCFALLVNTDPASVTCDWDGTAGSEGACAFTDCAQDYFDWSTEPGCESYCVQTATDDTLCNNRDDDCDSDIDEDVDFCGTVDCGSCGRTCVVLHGAPTCNKLVPTGPCSATNTECAILNCDTNWHDADGLYNTGCEYPCSLTDGGAGLGIEVCGDGIDNDCDSYIDGADSDLSGDPMVGQPCYGDPDGWCADPLNVGSYECVGQQIQCTGNNVVFEDDVAEICDGIDNDCDGTPDDNVPNAGDSCGNPNWPCVAGNLVCNGSLPLDCEGATPPGTEVCDGIDNDCDTTPDNNLTDTGQVCDVPAATPSDCTSACSSGLTACNFGVLECQGSVTRNPATPDTCGVDENCDGACTWAGNWLTDPLNCGTTAATGCGNDCYAAVGANPTTVEFECNGGSCNYLGCRPGWIDCVNPGDYDCETPCTPSGGELCNNYDDDCDCSVDNVLPSATPLPVQVCGTSVAATRPECTAPQVVVTCQGGNWNCAFPAGVCVNGCSPDDEFCEDLTAAGGNTPPLDNDCDGLVNENTGNWGQTCSTPATDGECQGSGTFECASASTAVCNATKVDCLTLPDQCVEYCDGKDNDCDGDIDEDFRDKGSVPGYFVQPAVAQVGGSLWMYAFEASRPDAGPATAGNGNGYHCTSGSECSSWGVPNPPAGVPLDSTIACSEPDKLPWFNVDPIEVEHTCHEVGGRICDQSDWQTACEAQNSCAWGYSPIGSCSSPWNGTTRDCNIWDHMFLGAPGAHGLLPAGDTAELDNCWADLRGLWTNPGSPVGAANNSLFDLTGNLREITRAGVDIYPLMGGSFLSAETGATCAFDFYTVNEDYKLFDTGFRCCFTVDPRL